MVEKIKSEHEGISDDIDKLISLQKQLDVEPVEVVIESKDVIKEYDFGHFSIVRAKGAFMYKSSGYRLIIKPTLGKLYTILGYVFDIKDNYEESSDDEKRTFDNCINLIGVFFNIPLTTFIDNIYTVNLYEKIIESTNELFERIGNSDPLAVDTAADAEFENQVDFIESLKDDKA